VRLVAAPDIGVMLLWKLLLLVLDMVVMLISEEDKAERQDVANKVVVDPVWVVLRRLVADGKLVQVR
jgi:hypothetical protein